jgi:hypothetical protein
MSKDRPKWPDSLPPFTEFVKGPRCVNLMVEDLQTMKDFEDLVYDLYWFPGDNYYLFSKYEEKLSRNLLDKFESQGILLLKTEHYFYRHPANDLNNIFIRLLPSELEHEWEIQTAKGQMYGRITLSLEEWRRKRLDITYIGQVAASKMDKDQPILDLKPGIWGFNLNLRSLYRRIKFYFKKS